MKKIIITTAVFATVALVSCQRENSIDKGSIASNDIVFSFSNASSTRSFDSPTQTEATIYSLGVSDEEGTAFALEETVVDLNEICAATKGTPVYTGNVGKLYNNDLFVHADGLAEGLPADAIYLNKDEKIDVEKKDNSEILGWRYYYNYKSSPWPGDDAVDFYFRMPSKMSGVKDDKYTYADNTIEFDYTSPVTTGEEDQRQDATVLQDLIFATRTLDKSTHDAALPHGAPILFRHALTGVKFATANYISGDVEGTKTYIKSVKFIGLKNSGKCVFNPDNTDEENVDDTDVYSSRGSFTWTPDNSTGTFIQNYGTSNHAQNVYSGSTLLTPEDTPSFFAEDKVSGVAGKKTNEWNINDQDGTMTFWFIPQQINSDDIKLEITFYIVAGKDKTGKEKKSEDITRTLNLKDYTKSANWKAGQLRTYILKATEVAVTVEDEMSEDGQTKNMIQIRNMGNVPQWVRATVVAYWADEDGNAIHGYNAAEGNIFVTPWSLDTEISDSPLYGKFTKDQNGTVGFPGAGWEAGKDGYYYFNDIIGVDKAATTNLFATYTITNPPTMYKLNRKSLAREEVDVHLEMKIVVQAILAKANQIRENDGSYTYTAAEDYKQAWADAKLN